MSRVCCDFSSLVSRDVWIGERITGTSQTRRRMSWQNGTCPWEQTGDAFMRFKSPKRSISLVMHYSPVPRGTLNVLCARSSPSRYSSPSSHSFFFFYFTWLSSRQSSRRVSFQLSEEPRAKIATTKVQHALFVIWYPRSLRFIIIIYHTIEILVNNTNAVSLILAYIMGHYVFRRVSYFPLLTDCLEVIYVNGFHECNTVYALKYEFRFSYVEWANF